MHTTRTYLMGVSGKPYEDNINLDNVKFNYGNIASMSKHKYY